METPPRDDLPVFYDRKGTQIGIERWTVLRADPAYKVLARDTIGTTQVFTVWFGTDQGDGLDGPWLFGTMTRNLATGDWGPEMFSRTEAEALSTHTQVLAAV